MKDFIDNFCEFESWEHPNFEQYRHVEDITDQDEDRTWVNEWSMVEDKHGKVVAKLMWDNGLIDTRMHPSLPAHLNIMQYEVVTEKETNKRRDLQGKRLSEAVASDANMARGAIMAMDGYMGLESGGAAKRSRGGKGSGKGSGNLLALPVGADPVEIQEEDKEQAEERKAFQQSQKDAVGAIRKNLKAMKSLMDTTESEVKKCQNGAGNAMAAPIYPQIQQKMKRLDEIRAKLVIIDAANHGKDMVPPTCPPDVDSMHIRPPPQAFPFSYVHMYHLQVPFKITNPRGGPLTMRDHCITSAWPVYTMKGRAFIMRG